MALDVWVRISADDCWKGCGEEGGLCEAVCGSNGYCCRKDYNDCPSRAGDVASPYYHTCVKETGPGRW